MAVELLPVLLVLVALGVTLYPLVARKLGSPQLARTGRISQLRDRYQAALADLQDIELDREVGNLSEDDYAPLRERYRRQAAVLLRELEAEQAVRQSPPRNGRAFTPLTLGLPRQGGKSIVVSHVREHDERGGEAGRLQLVTLSRSLALGLALAVLASLGVVSLYLRQVQQQAAQAPLAQLPITKPQAVAIDADGYRVAHAGGLLFSQDGRTWRPVDARESISAPNGSLAMLPQPSGAVLFMVSSGSVVRSSDDRRTWAAAAGAGNLALTGFVHSIAADPDRNALYAATDRGLFFTTALGTQWVQLPFRGGAAAIGVRGDQLAAVDADGRFFLSRDRGATWQG